MNKRGDEVRDSLISAIELVCKGDYEGSDSILMSYSNSEEPAVVEQLIQLLEVSLFDARFGAKEIGREYVIAILKNPEAPALDPICNDLASKILSLLKNAKACENEVEDALIRALKHDNYEIVCEAVEQLGERKCAKAAVGIASIEIRDEWPGACQKIKRAQIRALGKIGGEDAVQALIHWDKEEKAKSINICGGIIKALGETGEETAAEYMKNELEVMFGYIMSSRDIYELDEIIEALGRMRYKPAEDIIEKYLNHEKFHVLLHPETSETLKVDAEVALVRIREQGIPDVMERWRNNEIGIEYAKRIVMVLGNELSDDDGIVRNTPPNNRDDAMSIVRSRQLFDRILTKRIASAAGMERVV